MGKGLLVVALMALLVYVMIRFLEKRRAARNRPSSHGPRKSPPRRVIAPDDDADFLRDLEQKRRKQRREHDEQHGDADSS